MKLGRERLDNKCCRVVQGTNCNKDAVAYYILGGSHKEQINPGLHYRCVGCLTSGETDISHYVMPGGREQLFAAALHDLRVHYLYNTMEMRHNE